MLKAGHNAKAEEIHSTKCLKVCDSPWIKKKKRNQLTDGFVVSNTEIGVYFCPLMSMQKNGEIQNIVYF